MNEIKRNLNIGQHFLINKKIIKKEIEESNISKRDSVIEIGAGEGILTEEIAKRAKEIIVFEVDKRYSKKLDLLVKKYKNLKIIYDDAFNYSWKGCNKIVSNIPYFISEKTN
jgi:16S rRNA (adenine1518-N6/adenine1519-N6)-dimethyltransferase